MNQAEIDDAREKLAELDRLLTLRQEFIRQYADAPVWRWWSNRKMLRLTEEMRRDWRKLALERFPDFFD